MSDVEINGQLYRCGRMPTRVQLYVVKRLAPVFQGLAPLFAAEGGVNIYEGIAALTNTVGLLSDADADYVMDAALACVGWRQGAGWQPLRAPGGAFMIGAADRLDVQIRLLWEVLYESLSDFSLGLLLQSLTGANGADLEQQQADVPMVTRPMAGLNS